MDNFKELYLAATGRQDELRDGAFLDLPLNLCGVPCAPLTARRFAVLMHSRSPFLCGGVPMPEHVAQFLWALHPAFGYTNTEERNAFIQSCGAIEYESAVDELREFIEDCLMDSPPTSGNQSVSYNSWLASLVDTLAREYGWSEHEILELPMTRFFQYIRLIVARNCPNVPQFNKLTDGVKTTLLNQLNAKPEAN